MNEITHIHLGRQPFTISVEAHKALRAYLDAIAHEVGKKSQDVLDEIELRMAELLSERGLGDKKVVVLEDVNYLKEQLGDPRDFKDDDDPADEPEAKTQHTGAKRLYRDTQNGMLAGVASGLGAYFNIDPIIPRLLFVVLLFSGGAGIILYLLLWLLVPEAKTNSDRLQMQGKPVTVDTIKKMVDDADVPGAAMRASRLIEKIFLLAAKAFAFFVGLFFMIAGAAVFIWTFVAGVYTLIHGGQINDALIFPVGVQETWLLVCALVATLGISLLLILMGTAMMRRKWPVPGWATASIVGVIIVGASIGAVLGLGAAPDIAKRIDSMRQTHTQNVPAFTKAVLNGKETAFVYERADNYSVELRYFGKTYSEPIDAKVENNVLTVDTAGFADNVCKFLCFYTNREQTMVIRAPQMPEFTIGAEDDEVSFTIDKAVQQKELRLTAPKAVRLKVVAAAKDVTITDSPAAVQRSYVFTDITRDDSHARYVSADEYAVGVYGAESLTLNTGGAACEFHNPLVQLGQGLPKTVTINGQVPVSVEQLMTYRHANQLSPHNCIKID